MQILKHYLFNLSLLLACLGIMYLISPYWFGQIYSAFWLMFGPLTLLLILISAIPWQQINLWKNKKINKN